MDLFIELGLVRNRWCEGIGDNDLGLVSNQKWVRGSEPPVSDKIPYNGWYVSPYRNIRSSNYYCGEIGYRAGLLCERSPVRIPFQREIYLTFII